MTVTALAPSATYARLADLPLQVDSYALSPLELRLNDEFTRFSTVVHLHGAGEEGLGEDTTYAPPDQVAFRDAGPCLELSGRWTLSSFSARLDHLDLFPTAPHMPAFRHFRRWAFESAALDLALRQAGLSLAAALDREPLPVSFVMSPGPEDSVEPLLERLAAYPDLRFKLMPTPGWDDELVRALAATGAVDVIDLKGQYDEKVPVALAPDPELYRRVLTAFPSAWIEDPAITCDTEPLLRPHWHRVTWDAPIGAAADIAERSGGLRMVNMKPSRFGTIARLLDAYDFCLRTGIGMYGGGQFELGPGRGQIQTLASLFHPDAPNDVAPASFNEPTLRRDLPSSPLSPQAQRPGFR